MFLLLLAILAVYELYQVFTFNKVPKVSLPSILPGFTYNKGVYIWSQAYVLRLQYLKELENLIEWIVILSASFTIMTKQVDKCQIHQINLLLFLIIIASTLDQLCRCMKMKLIVVMSHVLIKIIVIIIVIVIVMS